MAELNHTRSDTDVSVLKGKYIILMLRMTHRSTPKGHAIVH